MLSSIRPICLKYGLTGDVIAAQGAIAADILTGDIFYSSGIPPALALEVVTDLEKDGEPVLVNVGDVLYYAAGNALTETYEKNSGVSGVAVGKLSDFLAKNQAPVQKVMAIVGAGRVEDKMEQYAEKYGGKCVVNTGFDPDRLPAQIAAYAERYQGRLVINSGFQFLMEIISPACTKGDTGSRGGEALRRGRKRDLDGGGFHQRPLADCRRARGRRRGRQRRTEGGR